MDGGRRILIRVDGDHAIGLGHIMRMRALALALAAEGREVVLLTRPDTSGERVLRDAGLDARPFRDGDLAEAVRAVGGADVAAVDTLDTGAAELAALRAGGTRRIVTFDDAAAGLAHADAVVNAIIFHWGRHQPRDVAARLCEGPDWMILQPDVVARRRPPREIAPQGRRVLTAFGGTDTRALTARALDLLAATPGPLAVRANLGYGAEPDPAVARAAAKSPHPVVLLRGAPSLAAEMVEADLVLCAGGVMLYELAALGVPAAAIAAEDHEAINIAWWAAAGTVVDLGHYAAFDAAAAARTAARLLADPAARRAMADRGPAIVDGRGLERCVALIKELAG